MVYTYVCEYACNIASYQTIHDVSASQMMDSQFYARNSDNDDGGGDSEFKRFHGIIYSPATIPSLI